MTPNQTQRERVLAEAVVSNYINELSTRERPARRPSPERRAITHARDARRRITQRRPALATA
jgi:hypothetical protein